MPRIDLERELCTVIVTVDAAPALMPELEAHARDGLVRFREFPGFIGGALHRSRDGGRLVQYLQWRAEEDHLACVSDAAWESLPSTRRFMSVVNAGQATLDVRTYTVVAATADEP